MGVAFVATRAIPTCEMALDGDNIADGMARNTFAKRNDATAGFVAGHGAQGDVFATPIVPFPNMDVRTAHRS